MWNLLKIATSEVKSVSTRVMSEIVQRVGHGEREFRQVWPLIDSIEGHLVSPMQERWLFRTARSLPDGAIIVEIGSFKGRSTACLAAGCRGGMNKRVFAIDTFSGNTSDFRQGELFNGEFLDSFWHNIEKCGLTAYVTPIQGWSLEIAKTWNKPIHLLFIDGSHQYEDVLADFENFLPHVIPGGIVAFHDVHTRLDGPVGWPGVLRVWQDVASIILTETGTCSSIAFGKKPLS